MYKTDERCHEKIIHNSILLVIVSLQICLFISYKDCPVRRKKTRYSVKATEYVEKLPFINNNGLIAIIVEKGEADNHYLVKKAAHDIAIEKND